MEMSMKKAAFWDVVLCSLVDDLIHRIYLHSIDPS
jgi:hypothetical protein